MEEEFGFRNAFMLWGILVLIGWSALLYFFRQKLYVALSQLGLPVSSKFVVRDGLVVAAMAIVLLGLARPYYGMEQVKIRSSGGDFLVVLDVSTSMLTADVYPSRLEFAKRKILDLVALISAEGGSDRIGLLLFSGQSYLYCPLTSDHSVLPLFINSITPELITSHGSNLREALRLAVQSLKDVDATSRRLIILSDGEDNDASAHSLVSLLRQNNVVAHALGVGTPEGQPIKLGDGTFVKELSGDIVVSKLREDLLETISQQSGGLYQRARLDETDLRNIIQRDGRESGRSKESTIILYREFGASLLWIPLLIILTLFLYGRKELILCLVVFISVSKVKAQSLYDSYKAYQEGRYDEARKGFENELLRDPNNLKVLQSLASSYYKLGNFDQALKLFERYKELAASGRELYHGHYNAGNSKFMQKDYQGAIADYERALEVKEGDEKATHNLEIAKKMLIKQQQEQQKEENKNKEQENQDKKNEEQKSEEKQEQDKQQQQQSDSEQSSSMSQGEKSAGSESSISGEGGNSSSSGAQSSGHSSDGEGGGENSGSSASGGAQGQESSKESEKEKEGNSSSHDPRDLKAGEAKRWLESLPDTPLLLRRPSGPKPKSNQTW